MSDFKSKNLRVLLFIPLFVSIALACSLFSPESPDATMDTLESQQVIVEPTQPAQEVVPLQDSPVVQQDVRGGLSHFFIRKPDGRRFQLWKLL